MKKLQLLTAIVIATFATTQIHAQAGGSAPVSVCLPATQDALLSEVNPTVNYGSNPLLFASRWTYGAIGFPGFYTTKSLLQFDVSTLPTGAVITSAIMKLHVDVTQPVYNMHKDLGGGTGNGATISTVGASWNEGSVTWNTAPIIGSMSTTFPSLGEGSTADVVVDVTTMVLNMVSTGVNNGFVIEMTDNSNYYHSLVSGSKENTSAGGIYRPELCVTYSTPCDKWSLCGNTIASTEFIGTLNAQPINFKTNNIKSMSLDNGGNLSISTGGISTYQKLYVETSKQNDGIQVNQTGTTAATMDLNASGGGGKRWALHSTGSGNSQGAGHLLFWDWTTNVERMRIDATGNVGIGTTSPTAKLDVTSVPTGGSIGIIGKGINLGVSGEAFEMTMAAVTQLGIDRGDKEAIGVFGKGTYTTTSGNGNVFGVAGSAVTANNPLNNIGVFGEAKNALGYNTGVIGWNDSTTGIYNTGTSGYVALNPTGLWSRAIAGYAPVAANHFAGYFEGKVAIVDGSQANNFVLTSDANGLATWVDPCTLSCLGSSTTSNWHLNGNALTNPTTDFIGTTDLQPLNFKTNGTQQLTIDANGNIGAGTTTPLHKLHVNDGALMLSGAVPSFGGPQLLFSDNVTTHPNGRWGLEYITATSSRPSMGGLNFWTPFNPGGVSGTAGNYSLFLKDDGKISMGATDDSSDANFCASALPNGYRLYVNGGLLTTKVKVANYCSSAWADFVFANDYKLKPLSEVEKFITENKHLPNVPSAIQIEKDGLDIAEMQSKQMEKIEELTLYLIEMKKEIEILKSENKTLKFKN